MACCKVWEVAMKLALVNVQGGGGRPPTAVNLATAFARSGLKVLAIDLDPQGSATTSFGVSREEASPSIAEVLFGQVELAGAVRETRVEGLDLLPASLRLAGA